MLVFDSSNLFVQTICQLQSILLRPAEYILAKNTELIQQIEQVHVEITVLSSKKNLL